MKIQLYGGPMDGLEYEVDDNCRSLHFPRLEEQFSVEDVDAILSKSFEHYRQHGYFPPPKFGVVIYKPDENGVWRT